MPSARTSRKWVSNKIIALRKKSLFFPLRNAPCCGNRTSLRSQLKIHTEILITYRRRHWKFSNNSRRSREPLAKTAQLKNRKGSRITTLSSNSPNRKRQQQFSNNSPVSYSSIRGICGWELTPREFGDKSISVYRSKFSNNRLTEFSDKSIW